MAEHTIGHVHEQMCAAVFVVYAGILEKFPRLRIGFLEGTCGWVPMLADRMDEEYEYRPHEAPLLTRKPSEYFKSGRLFVGIESDEWMIPTVIQFLGTDQTLLYASDYPHWDSDFPNTTRKLVARDDLTREPAQHPGRERAATVLAAGGLMQVLAFGAQRGEGARAQSWRRGARQAAPSTRPRVGCRAHHTHPRTTTGGGFQGAASSAPTRATRRPF